MTDTPIDQLLPVFEVIQFLKCENIDPILYGSRGVSIYLGKFRDFNDIDLLIDPTWLNDKWIHLQAVLSDNGFRLINEHEHEFERDDGIIVAFAEETVLIRDGIVTTLDDVVGVKTYIYYISGGLIEFLAIGTAIKATPNAKTLNAQLIPQAIIRDKNTFIDTAEMAYGRTLTQQ
jgi:hypothetical protein